jgi:hypothetical protein
MNSFPRTLFIIFIAIAVAWEPCEVALHAAGGNEQATSGICLLCNELAEEVGIRSSPQRVGIRTNLPALPIHGPSNILKSYLFGTNFLEQVTLKTPFILPQTQFRNTSTILRI